MSSYIGKIAFDKTAKEYVLITNCTCTLDHTPEGYVAAHNGKDCRYAPSEAIALRVLGIQNGKPVIGWTYRSVTLDTLTCNDSMQHERKDFETIMQHKRSPYYIGRV